MPRKAEFAPLQARVVRQSRIYYRHTSYSAFPHLIRQGGDELLLAFREAPTHEYVRHTHPRSVITVMRSYDLGRSWETKEATQVAAGGGQEFAPIDLGKGRIGAAVATHEVAPEQEADRAGLRWDNSREYPFSIVGGLWCWSDNWGLTWPLHQCTLVAAGMQCCAPPVQTADNTLLMPVYGRLGRAQASSSVLYRSTDSGASWSGPAVMARGNPRTRSYAEPALLEVGPEHLICLHRIGAAVRPGYFWQNESRDGGETWSRPRETHVYSRACPRLLQLRDGRILLTYGRREKPFGLYASLSDDGRTWTEESWLLRAYPDGDQGYSSSVQLDDDSIYTACYGKNARGTTGITGTHWKLSD